MNQEFHLIDRKFYDYLSASELEYKKQKAIYVGFEREKKNINTRSKISIPIKQIKRKDAEELISVMNQTLKNQCIINIQNEFCFGPFEKFEILNSDFLKELNSKWIINSR